ncbi:MAG: DUF427 domain-containing protein [Gemmatimonadota bacterium]|nr:DUF427 domain-containing protein [Gemmatimonadota bacterium]
MLPGQESAWSYPRPAIAQVTSHHLRVVHRGIVVADTTRGVRTLETSHPPTYYFPRADIAPGVLRPVSGASHCEWKGQAAYYDVVVGPETLERAAWSYPVPSDDFALIKDHVAFYAAPFDECTVNGEAVVAQEGGFYGGWITSLVAGPFKGGPGTRGW